MAGILVVDDDPQIRMLIAMILRDAAHTVTEASNGLEAMKVLASGSFDLILTDLIMPDKEGIETIMEVRRKHPALKIVAMSGGGHGSGEDYLGLASKLGASGTLSKPFGADQLRTTIQEALDR